MDNSEREPATDFGTLFQNLRTDLVSYTNKRVRHYRLDILERTSKSVSVLTYGLILAFFGLASFSFGLIAVALFLGEILGSNSAGFAVVSLFWLLLLVIVFLCRDRLKEFFLNKTADILYVIESEEEDEEQQ